MEIKKIIFIAHAESLLNDGILENLKIYPLVLKIFIQINEFIMIQCWNSVHLRSDGSTAFEPTYTVYMESFETVIIFKKLQLIF